MKALELYDRLEADFIATGMSDDWARYMGELNDYLTANFKERSMGLVCDFTPEINKVYSAVFPTAAIMQKVLQGGSDALLFLHHPSVWDIRRPKPFYQMDPLLLAQFREQRIAIYNLHVPLDHFGEYSTGKTLAQALGIEIERPFAAYRGARCGVIGRTRCQDVVELNSLFAQVLGHQTKLYLYGDRRWDGRIAIVAGGGNNQATVGEMIENQVKVLITGITTLNRVSAEVHQLEQDRQINVLGGTHYSTEKFACQAMCDYFHQLGLAATFLEDTPVFEDM